MLNGQNMSATWTNLAQTASPGDTTIVLKEEVSIALHCLANLK